MAPTWYQYLPPRAEKLLASDALFEGFARIALAALGAAGSMDRLDRLLALFRRKYRHVRLASSKVPRGCRIREILLACTQLYVHPSILP